MKRLAIIASIFTASILPAPVTHAAESVCSTRPVLVEALAEQYGESRVAIGVQSGHVVEIFASTSGTWSIVVTNARGLSCITAAGEAFELDAPTAPTAPDKGA